jgi:hypothetical protein
MRLGRTWDLELGALILQDAVLSIMTPVRTNSRSYSYEKVTLHPGNAKPAIYGDTAEGVTRTTMYFQGTLQGAMPTGIHLPRGLWEKGKEEFAEMWNFQLAASLDCLVRWQQYKVMYRCLNNPSPLKYFIRKNKEPIANMSVEDYYVNYGNDVVNIMRKMDGWNKFVAFDNKMLNTYYRQRAGDPTPWVWFTTPVIDEYVKFHKQENLLFLYSGKPRLSPGIKPELFKKQDNVKGDAQWTMDNFRMKKNMTLGKNLLNRNKEFPTHYSFKPWNMLRKKKVDLDDYDIEITNDMLCKRHCRIGYRDAVKALPLDDIHEFWENTRTKNKVSFGDLVDEVIIPPGGENDDDDDVDITGSKMDRVIDPISEGNVRKPIDYYMHMMSCLGLDELAEKITADINNGILKMPVDVDVANLSKEELKKEGLIDQSDLWKMFSNKLQSLVDTLFESFYYLDNNNNYITPVSGAAIKTFKNYIFSVFLSVSIPRLYTDYEPVLGEVTKLDVNLFMLRALKAGQVVLLNNAFGASYYQQKRDRPEALINLFKNHIFIHNTNLRQPTQVLPVIKKPSFKSLAENLLDIGIDMPFGVKLFKRMVINGDDVIHAKRGCITMFSQPLYASVVQQPRTGDINITMWQSYGEMLKEIRDVAKYEHVFFRKCVIGGNNRLWSKPKEKRAETGLKTFKHGSLWVVPVALNEVLGAKSRRMINRTGWDNQAEWDEVLGKLRLQDDHKRKMYYYSTWKKCCELYNWSTHRNNRYDEGAHYFDTKLVKYDQNHWPGYQRYVLDKTTEPAIGPLKNHPFWWEEQRPVLDTRSVQN